MQVKQLLRLLADGQFHSGEDLAAKLSVSRAAISKQLSRLRQAGLDYNSVKGRGYRIVGGLSLLDEAEIRRHLLPAVQTKLQSVDILLSTASTNESALQGIRAGNMQGALYLAEHQSAGRGRRGRVWNSPFASNLYFSLVWSFQGGAAALQGLSLAVGLAVARALESEGVSAVQLKWPNDVQVAGRKLVGVLLEMTGDATGLCQVVIGVGVNVNMPDAADQDIDQPWTDLRRLGIDLDRNALMAAVLNQLLPLLDEFARTGFAACRQAYNRYDALRDQPVQLLEGGQSRYSGLYQGVDEQGAVQLQTADGRKSFHQGELSLRLAH